MGWGTVDYATLTWITAIPTASMMLGMVLVQFWQPTPKLTALMQHFGAGVVCCAVACEILPVVLSEEYSDPLDYLGIIAGFAVGVTVMLLIARLIPKYEAPEEKHKDKKRSSSHKEHSSAKHKTPGSLPNDAVTTVVVARVVSQQSSENEQPSSHNVSAPHMLNSDIVEDDPTVSGNSSGSDSDDEATPLRKESIEVEEDPKNSRWRCPINKGNCARTIVKVPWGLIVPVATDGAMDGLLIGITYIGANLYSGIVMAIALAIEMCFLGMSTSNQMAKNDLPRAVAIPICLGLPFFIIISGYIGAAILANVSGPIFVGVVSFGMAALLFLISDELLVEAHKEEENDTWWVTIFFFIGFGTVTVLQKVLENHLSASSSEHLFCPCPASFSNATSTSSSSSISSSM
ncbi:zinc transporter [Pelomyxa schiedti]|nr:zinc transporter [Pelomyxa schiedti]